MCAGHGPLPQLTGNVSDVLVSSLLQSCYLSSQTLPRVYQHYGPSPIQPLSTEMQILLTVYYLVQLGKYAIFISETCCCSKQFIKTVAFLLAKLF